MKISINWLKDYVETNSQPEEISEILTNLGLEVEKLSLFESVKGGLMVLLLVRFYNVKNILMQID